MHADSMAKINCLFNLLACYSHFCVHLGKRGIKYGTTQRQLDAHSGQRVQYLRVISEALVMSVRVPGGIFPVLSKACP